MRIEKLSIAFLVSLIAQIAIIRTEVFPFELAVVVLSVIFAAQLLIGFLGVYQIVKLIGERLL